MSGDVRCRHFHAADLAVADELFVDSTRNELADSLTT
jgi:hypothetical protein